MVHYYGVSTKDGTMDELREDFLKYLLDDFNRVNKSLNAVLMKGINAYEIFTERILFPEEIRLIESAKANFVIRKKNTI